jgi:hypothetical protein
MRVKVAGHTIIWTRGPAAPLEGSPLPVFWQDVVVVDDETENIVGIFRDKKVPEGLLDEGLDRIIDYYDSVGDAEPCGDPDCPNCGGAAAATDPSLN